MGEKKGGKFCVNKWHGTEIGLGNVGFNKMRPFSTIQGARWEETYEASMEVGGRLLHPLHTRREDHKQREEK